jgi:sigma-B regulation protein RsbU (phosphoserine phosphatase)
MIAEILETSADVRKVLVVDDQQDVREALRLLLKGAGYVVETAESPGDALAATAYGDYDIVVADMNFAWDTTSGQEGLQLLDQLRAQRRDVPIVAMTGWSNIELAVEAMQHGACDFVPKPWDNRNLLAVLRKHLDADAAPPLQLKSELAAARKVQRKLLPERSFRTHALELECASLPAGEIGGDLYDFFNVDDAGTAFVLGDICGKGIGAALLMANLQATIRSQQSFARQPSELMRRVNSLFFQSTRPEHFATLFYGLYDSGSRTMRYVNCGHPSAVLVRSRGDVELLDATATLLGAFKDRDFPERSVRMNPGDRLVLFSDGFSEAKMDEMEDDWAVRTITSRARSLKRGLAGVLASAAACGGPQADDITVMDLRAV